MSVGIRLAVPVASPRPAAFRAGRERLVRAFATTLAATAAACAIVVVAVAAVAARSDCEPT
jgi:hypothetical protein